VLVLALDTATPRVTVAIGEDGRVRGEIGLTGRRRHAEQVAPAVAYLCDQTRVQLSQLAAIAVGIGPGLFTGLRVGVTTAKVMAQALRIPVVAVSSLDLVAYPLRHAGRLIATVLDARRGEVYHAQYRPVPGGVQRVSDYAVGPAGELVAELAATGDEVLLAGDGVDAYRDEFAALERAEPAGPGFEAPSATALVELATGRVEREEFSSPWEVTPLYLRASDAELAWEQPR
jgi:tRNA threonylcarbamoyladenosine biosynthesis protein TsaB